MLGNEAREYLETALSEYPPILVAEQVAEILQVGRVKAYTLLRTNEIQSFRVGDRNIRTTKEAVIGYILTKGAA